MDTTYIAKLTIEASCEDSTVHAAERALQAAKLERLAKREKVIEYLNESFPDEPDKRRWRSVDWPCIITEGNRCWVMDITIDDEDSDLCDGYIIEERQVYK